MRTHQSEHLPCEEIMLLRRCEFPSHLRRGGISRIASRGPPGTSVRAMLRPHVLVPAIKIIESGIRWEALFCDANIRLEVSVDVAPT